MHNSQNRAGVVQRILSLGVPPDATSEDRRRSALINGLCTVGFVFLMALGFVAVDRGLPVLATSDFIGAGFLLTLLVFHWLVGLFRIVVYGGVAFIGVFFLYLLAFGGENQSTAYWMFLFPLVATFLLGGTPGLVASLSALVLACLNFIFDPLFPSWTNYEPSTEIRWATAFLVISVFAYIAERIRLDAMAEAREAEAEARRASAAKSEFLGRMSHELRTPLNHVLGFAAVIESERVGSLNAIQKEYLSDILTSGRHLLGIIDELLDLTRIEEGKVDVFPEAVDVGGLLQECSTVIAVDADQKGIEVSVCRPDTEVAINADPRLIRQVLHNLLQNAVKFTPVGGTVVIEATVGNDDSVTIGVVDDGIGVSEVDRDRVFRTFERGTTNEPGVGLGLALASRFVELQGGTIGVKENDRESGSTFWIRFPSAQEGDQE